MKYIRKFDSAAAMAAAIASLPRPFVAWDGVAEENINLNFGEPTEAPTTTTEAPTTTTEAPVTVDYTEPFYVENITQQNETLTIIEDTTDREEWNHPITFEKSTDGTTWSTLGTTGSTPLTIIIIPGDKLYLRANTNTIGCRYASDMGWLTSVTKIRGVSKVGGNIHSLLYGNTFNGQTTFRTYYNDYVFLQLFSGNTNLIDASDLLLSDTILGDSCYNMMFQGCTSLTAAPALPATTLASYCYNYMFYNCTSLTTAPTLPATTLANYCYQNMFSGCTSLTSAPALPATTLANYCYQNMFYGCTSLTTAPVLPATTLTQSCYNSMFGGCTNLNYIKCLATNKSASNCTQYWVDRVAANGTFVKDPNMSTSTWGTGSTGIPSGWTVEDAA